MAAHRKPLAESSKEAECSLLRSHQTRLLAELDRLTLALLEARRDLDIAEKAAADLAMLKRSLSYRATHLLDRFPAAKNALIRLGNLIFPE